MSRKKSHISSRVEEIRLSLGGMSQKSLAKNIGINEKTFNHFIGNGEMGHAINRAFLENGYSVDWIMTGEGSMFRDGKASSVRPPQASLESGLALLQLFAKNPHLHKGILSKVKSMVDAGRDGGKLGKSPRPRKGPSSTKSQS